MEIGRRHPPHIPPIEGHNQTVIVLVTVCTKDRRSILARQEAFDLLCSAWRQAGDWQAGRFVIMPDHLHVFCGPAVWPPRGLARWVGFWKATVSRAWVWPEEQPIWQQNFWDRQVRSGEHYGDRWEYVRQNPVRAGLAANAEDWPFQGEIEVLRW